METFEEQLVTLRNKGDLEGFIIMNREGIPIRAEMTSILEKQSCLSDVVKTGTSSISEKLNLYSEVICQFVSRTASVIQTLDEKDDVVCIKIRSKNSELLMIPDQNFCLFGAQYPASTSNDVKNS